MKDFFQLVYDFFNHNITDKLILCSIIFLVTVLAISGNWYKYYKGLFISSTYRFNVLVIGYNIIQFLSILFFIGFFIYGLLTASGTFTKDQKYDLIVNVLKGVEYLFISSIPFIITVAFRRTLVQSFEALLGFKKSGAEDLKNDNPLEVDESTISRKKNSEFPQNFSVYGSISHLKAKMFFVTALLGVVLTNILEMILKWRDFKFQDLFKEDVSSVGVIFWQYQLFQHILPILVMFLLAIVLFKYYKYLHDNDHEN